jgi:hypothetical protein
VVLVACVPHTCRRWFRSTKARLAACLGVLRGIDMELTVAAAAETACFFVDAAASLPGVAEHRQCGADVEAAPQWHASGDDSNATSCDGGRTERRRGEASAGGDNINLRASILHIIGDLVQSVGVALAAALIWWNQVRSPGHLGSWPPACSAASACWEPWRTPPSSGARPWFGVIALFPWLAAPLGALGQRRAVG